jgi:PAS domain S-box-containing protein
MEKQIKQPADRNNKADIQYKALVGASNLGVWEYSYDSGYLWCNDIYFTMLGRDKSDYDLSGNKNLEQTWIELLHPEDRAPATGHFEAYLKKPVGFYESFFRMKHADESWVWIWSKGGLADDKIIGTHTNITELKRAEEQIQNERILLRTLIDNLPDTIYIKDIDGRKIIANRADVKAIGAASEADVIGKTDLDLFPNSTIAHRGYDDDMEVLQLGKVILNKEEFFIDKDGTERWLTTSKVPVRDENGQIIRLLGIGHNITDRKRSEAILSQLNDERALQSAELSKQAEDLKLLNQQLTLQKEQELKKAIAQGKFEIASEVLHDIGNAMVGFGSHLNRISRAVEQNNLENVKNLALFLKSQQQNFAGVIGVDKAAALVAISDGIASTQTDNQLETRASIAEVMNIITHIQEILNIQRQFVRGHEGAHDRKPVNLVNIIDDCRSMLFASIDKKGIQLKMRIAPGNHIIKGDHTKLMQVMLNVLKNSVEAIDFDADEKMISIALEPHKDTIELIITDNGQGFDKETAARLFGRGFTTKKSGTGLGLYNCRSIVESHTGSFEIKSDGPGLGAVTTIKFAL